MSTLITSEGLEITCPDRSRVPVALRRIAELQRRADANDTILRRSSSTRDQLEYCLVCVSTQLQRLGHDWNTMSAPPGADHAAIAHRLAQFRHFKGLVTGAVEMNARVGRVYDSLKRQIYVLEEEVAENDAEWEVWQRALRENQAALENSKDAHTSGAGGPSETSA